MSIQLSKKSRRGGYRPRKQNDKYKQTTLSNFFTSNRSAAPSISIISSISDENTMQVNSASAPAPASVSASACVSNPNPNEEAAANQGCEISVEKQKGRYRFNKNYLTTYFQLTGDLMVLNAEYVLHNCFKR